MNKHFKQYVGPEKVCDATVERIVSSDKNTNVFLRSEYGEQFAVEFSDVLNVNAKNADGMMVFALAEMSEKHPFRKFIFVNNKEKDDSTIEIVARNFGIHNAH